MKTGTLTIKVGGKTFKTIYAAKKYSDKNKSLKVTVKLTDKIR